MSAWERQAQAPGRRVKRSAERACAGLRKIKPFETRLGLDVGKDNPTIGWRQDHGTIMTTANWLA